MKIRLLNNGGYGGFENVTFPVEVNGEVSKYNTGVDVSRSELARAGIASERNLYFSLVYRECEVVE